MAELTGIEWATSTFNPWWGCARVSRACDHCYAETLAARFNLSWGKTAGRRFFGDKHWNEPIRWNRKAAASGEQWRVFSASMADVFEARTDLDEPRARLWKLIEATPALTWMLLTKRPQNVTGMVPWKAGGWPVNVWLGVTAEDQRNAYERIPILWDIPAWTRFLSCEPLAGPIDLGPYLAQPKTTTAMIPVSTTDRQEIMQQWQRTRRWTAAAPGIDWVITGGESGPKARPSHPDWFRAVRDVTVDRGVPFFFKQWGEYAPWATHFAADREEQGPWDTYVNLTGSTGTYAISADHKQATNWTGDPLPGNHAMSKVGKKVAGAELDGKQWKQIPESLEAPF